MNALARVALLLGALALAGTTACKKEPDPAQIHREAGDKHLGKNEYKQAAEEYGKSLEADPKQDKVWDKKAFAHMNAGDLEQAEAALLKTLDLKPDAGKKAEVYRNIAGMYLQKQALDKAEKYFGEAVKVDPNDTLSLGWLGEIYAQRGGARDMNAPLSEGDLAKALEYYDKVIALKPELPETYLNKRIVIAKYMDTERKELQAAEAEAKGSTDEAQVKAAQERAEKHKKRMDEFKAQFEEITKKLTEAQKAAKK